MQKGLTIIVLILLSISVLFGCETSSNSDETNKNGKDYELMVWQTFWEGASEIFGVEYSDYKVAQTSYSYICDNTTSDGYTSFYYLINTAYESKDVSNKTVLHPVTARCYYVPDYSDTVYVTYITCDGESIYFDEDTEDWLMGIGSKGETSIKFIDEEYLKYSISKETEPVNKERSSTPNIDVKENSNYDPQQNNNFQEYHEEEYYEEEYESNDFSDLEYVVNQTCNNYNSGDTAYGGQLYATVESSTAVTIEHYINQLVPLSEEDIIYSMQDTICNTFSDILNEEFPELIEVTVYTTVTFYDDSIAETEESDDLDGLVGRLPDDLRYELQMSQ